MPHLTHPTYDIQRVREMLPRDGGTQVAFETGLSACVPKEYPDYERLLPQARTSLLYGTPVALMSSDTGEVVELTETHQSAVRQVRPDEEDPSRLLVEFWAYSPICYLTKDHPDFERLAQTLKHAAAADTPGASRYRNRVCDAPPKAYNSA